MARRRRDFTPEFKAEAVQLWRTSGKTRAEVARDLGLTDTARRRWIQRADADAGHGKPGVLTSSEREELAALRRENKQLLMERDFLKRAAVFLPRRPRKIRVYRGRAGSLRCPLAV